MADRTQLLSLDEINAENMHSMIKSKQILSDSTNIHLKKAQTSSDVNNPSIRRQRHVPLTLATIRRYKEAAKRRTPSNTIPLDNEILKAIEDFQQKQTEQQQRAMYNARQTPLIPLIAELDLSVLTESLEQDDLLMDILTLVNNIDEECSFFEQFQI